MNKNQRFITSNSLTPKGEGLSQRFSWNLRCMKSTVSLRIVALLLTIFSFGLTHASEYWVGNVLYYVNSYKTSATVMDTKPGAVNSPA